MLFAVASFKRTGEEIVDVIGAGNIIVFRSARFLVIMGQTARGPFAFDKLFDLFYAPGASGLYPNPNEFVNVCERYLSGVVHGHIVGDPDHLDRKLLFDQPLCETFFLGFGQGAFADSEHFAKLPDLTLRRFAVRNVFIQLCERFDPL